MSLHKEFVWWVCQQMFILLFGYVYISAELSYLMMLFMAVFQVFLWRLSRNYISVKIFYSYFIYTFSFIFIMKAS